ncbi:carbonic anhydrase 7 [Rhipicephalus sanguineus]|uniref:carbonic anhydrase 7 n=1 Tax=Rhipicephalus sanguineus TaxID=34632 RepID=UPI0020C223BD|nr:carbonic anhydrase 7 [Rhipicephalus sanguineus]
MEEDVTNVDDQVQVSKAEANHSQHSRIADVYHWYTSEKFIQAYRRCRVENWSYETLPLCLKYDTTDILNYTAWHRRYPSCGGSQQSPILVLFAQSEYKYFDPIQFLNYDSYLQIDIEMVGTTRKHPSQLSKRHLFFYPFGVDLGVFGGPLQVQYSFFMGTIHIGKDRHSGSEHFIENQGYAAEVQLIHTTEMLSDNDCLKEANGLLVLVILFEEKNDDNEDLAPLLDAMQELQDNAHNLHTSTKFLMSSLIPDDTLEYYIYPGSLSFPPCTERTINVVFQRTVPIGQKQLEELRKLRWRLGGDASCTGPLAGNVRPITDGRGGVKSTRTIFRSFFSFTPSTGASTHAVRGAAVALFAVVASSASLKQP